MLKRNSLQDKKKKKKNDIDRKRQTICQLIERELKESNGQTQGNQIINVSLDQLEPGKFMLNPSQNLIHMYKDLKNHIEEFVQINNEYIGIKVQEEKAKNKKQKTAAGEADENGLMTIHSGGQKLEEISFKQEVERNVKLLTDSIPDKIR